HRGAQRPRPGGRRRRGPRGAGGAGPRAAGHGDHPAVRRGGRARRAHRVPGAGGPARRTAAGRRGLPPDRPAVPAGRAGADPAGRHRRPGDRAARRGAGGRDDRPDRRARVHRPPPQPTAGGPVTTAATPMRRAPRSRRPLLAVTSAGLLLLALVLVRVLVGEPMVPIDLALRVLTGEAVPGYSFIVLDHRLPTAVVALLAGVAFRLSGTVFQTLLRTPLASPDVIGVTLGSSAGAVIAMAFFQADGRALFWFALLGGLATAVLLLAVAGAGGPGASGGADNRFVLVGIGVAAALTALISYLLTRLSLKTAGDALHWMIGSLSASTWDRAAVLACALAVLIPLLGLLVPRLRILQLGDDTATSLGLDVPRTRTSLVLVAVALCALTVAVTGPLSFVAFLAGPIAQRLAGRPSFPLSAVVGAVIVLLADIAGQNLFGDTQLPAGVVTGALGAPF